MTNENMRNKPCTCGSGKKYKFCCINKKPRKTNLTMEMGKIDGSVKNHVEMRFASGNVEILINDVPRVPEAALSQISYEKKKQTTKIINQISLDTNQLASNPDYALKKYDLIFAIDTNTDDLNGEEVSISCCLATQLDLTYYKDKPSIQKYAIKYFMEFRSIKQKAENIAWMTFIQRLISETPNLPQLKIGLIVDSDLGNIPAFNNQSLPIYADFYLPQNIELIYASADKKGHLVNWLISICDKEAKYLINDILKIQLSNQHLQEFKGEPYTHFGLWIPRF